MSVDRGPGVAQGPDPPRSPALAAPSRLAAPRLAFPPAGAGRPYGVDFACLRARLGVEVETILAAALSGLEAYRSGNTARPDGR